MTHVKAVEMVPEGPQFSEIVQGYWRMGEWGMSAQEHLSFLNQHIELGVTTVDHAHVYGDDPSCEALFGAVLSLQPGLREKIQIVSKCGIELVAPNTKAVNHYDSSSAAIIKSVETSLTRMNIDCLDVLLIHRPDWLMDATTVADTFEQLRHSGKVRHFGVSNFTVSQFDLLQSRLGLPLVTNQIEINPLHIDPIMDGTIDRLTQAQVRPMAWSCLAGGRIFNDNSEQLRRLNSVLGDIADEVGADAIDQVIYTWVMMLPCKPVPIVGSGNITRVRSAVDALKIKLTREQWYRIWVASKGHDVP